MSNLFRLSSTAALAVAIAAFHCLPGAVEAQNLDLSLNGIYNENEERGSFDLIMQPYPIPITTTTYVDFVFNLPENIPDLFHVVFGEVINSQPIHLHHFVVTGCANTFDSKKEGIPIQSNSLNNDCAIQLGGWAPGSNVFGNVDMDVGVLMGRGLGVKAVRLNVHYTSGVYEDETNKTFKMATDGIRVHYTPDFRPYTSMAQSLISIGFGPADLVIPPNQSRFYLTRTCKVDASCKDISEEEIQNLVATASSFTDLLPPGINLEEVTCSTVKPLCSLASEIGKAVRQFCPTSCGFCEKIKENGEVNPLNPGQYRMSSISYHAHLLGREMYTTLLREETGNDGTITTDATDLKSKELWIYDDQGVYPFDFNDTADRRGLDIKPGDKIQVTCVYNSKYRTEDTIFGVSTYDEMCIITSYVTFETPPSLMATNGDDETIVASNEIAFDLATELSLMTFRCQLDDESAVHTGVLEADEDARDIWKDHPIEDSKGCTFPVFEGTGAVANGGVVFSSDCPANDYTICSSDSMLMSDAISGGTCYGGTYDGRDSNEGFSKSDCVEGGGQYFPYTCEDVQNYINYDAESDGMSKEDIDYMITVRYQPKCCKDADLPGTDGEDPKEDEPKEEEPNTDLPGTGGEDPKEEKPEEEEPKDNPDPKEGEDDSAAPPRFERSSVVLALSLLLYHSACNW